MKFDKETFRIPEWALPYLVNRDRDNLTDSEIDQLKSFLAINMIIDVGGIGEDAFFAHSNDVDDLGAMCYDIECSVWPYNPPCKKYPESEAIPDENDNCSLCGGDCVHQ